MKKVLLIDDDQAFSLITKEALESTGEFVVLTTFNGKEGLEIAKKEKPDMVLLDRMMPQLPGQQVAVLFANDPTVKSIPVVFLTSMISKQQIGSEEITFIEGANYIPKDVGVHKLVAAVKKFLAAEKI